MAKIIKIASPSNLPVRIKFIIWVSTIFIKINSLYSIFNKLLINYHFKFLRIIKTILFKELTSITKNRQIKLINKSLIYLYISKKKNYMKFLTVVKNLGIKKIKTQKRKNKIKKNSEYLQIYCPKRKITNQQLFQDQ